jgi:N-acetylglucosaminyldiphosphoundecaprenol N-acetyl-beta-D-mannosaminyltransferase
MSRFATVLGTRIDAVSEKECVDTMIRWARRGEARYVCACNVHSVVSARRDPAFARVLAEADLCVPDGAPVAWSLRRSGFRRQQRVAGPDIMWHCLQRAAQDQLPVFFYGATQTTLAALIGRLRHELPDLRIAGSFAPPFRRLTSEEDRLIIESIRRSGARLVFVALGCPKQEAWMRSHRKALPGVALGAGAAFDFLAGTQERAPRWIRAAGLEWAHRLWQEPRRLWRRYFVTNTLFLAWTLRELLGGRLPAFRAGRPGGRP